MLNSHRFEPGKNPETFLSNHSFKPNDLPIAWTIALNQVVVLGGGG